MHLFSSCWDDLEDPRTGNARLRDLLLIAPCTVLCGGQTATDITAFARAKETICAIFSRFPRVRPAMTPSRACSAGFDPVRFRAWLQRFTAAFGAQIRGGVEMGGKVLRRSYDKTSVTSAPHMVGARCCEADLMRAQIATDAKSNEIVAVPKLPQMLSLKGTLVTADALNCQRPAAAQIVEQGGDYAVPLRGNQPTLHAEVSLFLDDPATSPDDRHQSVEADHGRIETRTTTVSTEIGWLAETHKWPGLRAIGKVVRQRETDGKTSTETAYYVFSTPMSVERFDAAVRSHCQLENRLHWRLDVEMNQDQARNRAGHGVHNLAVLRHTALNVVQRGGPRDRCAGNSSVPPGTRAISPAYRRYSEVRLPFGIFC